LLSKNKMKKNKERSDDDALTQKRIYLISIFLFSLNAPYHKSLHSGSNEKFNLYYFLLNLKKMIKIQTITIYLKKILEKSF